MNKNGEVLIELMKLLGQKHFSDFRLSLVTLLSNLSF